MNSRAGQEAALHEIVTALRESASAVSSFTGSVADGSAEQAGASALQCVLCRLAARSAERSLRTFFSEFVNDPRVRENFRGSRGFCREHTPMLAQCGEALGVAILYADLADEIRRRWRSKCAPQKRTLLSRWLPAAEAPICPACSAEADAEARFAAALAHGLHEDESLWELLDGDGSLCARHVEAVAATASPGVAARLLADECLKMDRLCAELEEFVRKNDYRFRDEPWGSERDSWRRALLRLCRR